MHRSDIKFLCKGAKLNVRPSRMSSQISSGVVAYEHKLGVRASRKYQVNIFQHEDQVIINNPQMQIVFSQMVKINQNIVNTEQPIYTESRL